MTAIVILAVPPDVIWYSTVISVVVIDIIRAKLTVPRNPDPHSNLMSKSVAGITRKRPWVILTVLVVPSCKVESSIVVNLPFFPLKDGLVADSYKRKLD